MYTPRTGSLGAAGRNALGMSDWASKRPPGGGALYAGSTGAGSLRRAGALGSAAGASHNPAHEALAAASQWLAADVRDKKRVPPSGPPAFAPLSARQPRAESGLGHVAHQPLTARGGRSSAAEVAHPERLPPPEVSKLCDEVAAKAASKFRSTGEAFRKFQTIEADSNGHIDRGAMRRFFMAYDCGPRTADSLFDHLDPEGNEEVEFENFVNLMNPYFSTRRTGSSLDHHAENSPKASDAKDDGAAHTPSGGRPTPALRGRASPMGGLASESPHAAGGRGLETDRLRMLKELTGLMQDIGQKLPMKFKRPRDAFKMLDTSRNGRINRMELRMFFQGFGHGDETADKIFDWLAEDHGEVDFNAFVGHFSAVLGPSFRCAQRAPMIEVEDKRLEKELNDIAIVIQERLMTKYKSVQDAFRAMDLNKDGTVQLSELKLFFRSFGMAPTLAEKVFGVLSESGVDEEGGVRYDEFVQLLGAPKPTRKAKAGPSSTWRLSNGGVALCV